MKIKMKEKTDLVDLKNLLDYSETVTEDDDTFQKLMFVYCKCQVKNVKFFQNKNTEFFQFSLFSIWEILSFSLYDFPVIEII